MSVPKLVIRKRMLFIQGKVRPCCYVQLSVEPGLRAALDEHFLNEPLFKRAAYSTSWPAGALAIPAALAPHVQSFLKNDACPEITIKTMLAGQMFQGANTWEMMCFEFIAKLAFENFLGMAKSISEMGRDVVYEGEVIEDLQAFNADTAAEMKALQDPVLAA